MGAVLHELLDADASVRNFLMTSEGEIALEIVQLSRQLDDNADEDKSTLQGSCPISGNSTYRRKSNATNVEPILTRLALYHRTILFRALTYAKGPWLSGLFHSTPTPTRLLLSFL